LDRSIIGLHVTDGRKRRTKYDDDDDDDSIQNRRQRKIKQLRKITTLLDVKQLWYEPPPTAVVLRVTKLSSIIIMIIFPMRHHHMVIISASLRHSLPRLDINATSKTHNFHRAETRVLFPPNETSARSGLRVVLVVFWPAPQTTTTTRTDGCGSINHRLLAQALGANVVTKLLPFELQ
jgi:hypothetical protein